MVADNSRVVEIIDRRADYWTPSFAQGDRQFVGKGGLASTVYAVDRYPREGTMGQRRDARNYFRNQLSLWIV
jgi:hypothetical protein